MPLGGHFREAGSPAAFINRNAARKWVLARIERRRESFGTIVPRPLPPSLPLATYAPKPCFLPPSPCRPLSRGGLPQWRRTRAAKKHHQPKTPAPSAFG